MKTLKNVTNIVELVMVSKGLSIPPKKSPPYKVSPLPKSFVFMKHPFGDSPFCLITDEIVILSIPLVLEDRKNCRGATYLNCE